MTIGLSYDSNLSRVQIALSGYDDGTVRIERSTNQLFWTTVRGGVELPIISGSASLNDAEFTPDVQNFYRTLALDPPPGLVLDGSGADYASTPDNAALDITGDIDIRVDATLVNWNPGSIQTLVGKYNPTGDQRSYSLHITTAGLLRLIWSTAGTSGSGVGTSSAVTPGAGAGQRLAVRVTLDVNNGAAGRTVTFYTAPTMDGPWTILDAPIVTAGTTSIHSGTAEMRVGTNAGATETVNGIIHAVEVRNGISGTAVANPDFAAQDNGDTSFVDNAGRTWTVNGSAEIRGEVLETNSITPDLDGTIWLKVPVFPFLNREVECIISGDVERPSRTGIFEIKGRSLPVAVTDFHGSQQFTLVITTRTMEEARDMDLILALGKTMLIHVPQEDTSGCGPLMAVPGGYVQVGDVTQRRAVPGSRIYSYTLPCVVVAPPGPDVIPTSLIWGTVFNLYGDWNALIASNPTWADLLATVGSPEDTVVL